jgi:membrane associated rhomboid family serine protease
MGLHDREYYRNSPAGGGGSFGGDSSSIWFRLIVANVAVFVLQLLTLDAFRGGGVTGWLEMDPERVIHGFQFWRLLTYAFCHDPNDIWHLIGNMLFLYICGRQVEPIYGAREFLRMYLAAAVLAGVCYLAFGLATDLSNPMLGASGAVMAVAMLCALYYPTMEIIVMFVLPVQLRWIVAAYVVYDLYPVLAALGGGRFQMDDVAHSAHLGGLLYGYLYKRFDLRFSRLFADGGWPWFRQLVPARVTSRGRKVRLYKPPEERESPADLERKVDEILAKISEKGESSLTDAEREVLKEASRRYKHR